LGLWVFGSLQKKLPTKAQSSQQRGQRDAEWWTRRGPDEETGREMERRARRGGKVPLGTVLSVCSVREGRPRTSFVLPAW